MCQELEQIYSEGMEIGERKKAKETVKSLSEMGLSVDKIAKAVNGNIDTVKTWLKE